MPAHITPHGHGGPVSIFTWLTPEEHKEEQAIREITFIAKIAVIKQRIISAKSSIFVINHSAIKAQASIAVVLRRNIFVKQFIEVLDKTILEIFDVLSAIEDYEAKRK